MLTWIILVAILLAVDFYAFQSVKTLTKNKVIHIFYWLLSFAVLINFVYELSTNKRSDGISQSLMLSFGLLILSTLPKILALLVLFSEDIFRIIKTGKNYFSNTSASGFFPDIREFISKIALGVASVPFTSVLYGMVEGKYNYQVIRHNLYFDDLPDEFNGFKLTHISDIHSGSFDNADKISYGIDLINEQESDVILFTGDIVNNTADEMDEWIPYFKRLDAKYGKYSVLGNHDYGEYIQSKTPQEKEKRFQAIKDIHPKIGFHLLLNDSIYLERNNQKIALVGVENWGTRFKKVGDLELASSKINKDDFKILLSHDPSHWESEVKNHDYGYQLTLSGHTHGMQFGIEIPGVKWSPVQYIYKQWAGIYKEFGRYINVNRGFGFLGFPGRVGIWPEITVITLKKR